MIKEIDAQTTRELLFLVSVENDIHTRYVLSQLLIKRWSSRVDLDSLVELLESEKSRERLMGVFYLGELRGGIEELKDPVTLLADDSISYCRQAFVNYVLNSRFYDENISRGLAKCLLDFDLYVRVTAIKWGISTSSKRFEDFSRLVEAGGGGLEPRLPRNPLGNKFWNDASLRRGIRGLEFIRRIRAGEDIQNIRIDCPEEDSFISDNILFSNTRRERALKMREKKRMPL